MISTLDLGPDIQAYRTEGKITRQDIERVFEDLDRAKENSADGLRVYLEIPSFEGMTLEALWTDLRLGIQNRDIASSVEKVALVTDVGWLHKAGLAEDRIFRGIQIRPFPLTDRDEARAFVSS